MNLLTDETLDAIRRGLAVTPRTLPSPEIRENIINRHRELVEAIEAHQAWTLNPPHPGLFHVWDFVNRSMYIMSELGNIAAGRPVRYPEQIPPNPHATDRAHSAVLSFQDVITRSLTTDEIIQNPRMLVMLGLAHVDFGDTIRQRSYALSEAIAQALT